MHGRCRETFFQTLKGNEDLNVKIRFQPNLPPITTPLEIATVNVFSNVWSNISLFFSRQPQASYINENFILPPPRPPATTPSADGQMTTFAQY